MVRSLKCLVLFLAALAVSACTVVLPLAEEALVPATTEVPETASTVPPTVAVPALVATATLRSMVEPVELDLETLDLPNEQLQALGEALFEYGLLDTGWLTDIAAAGPITLLAPSDRAFAAVNRERLDGMLQDREAPERFVRYHVIPGVISLEELVHHETLLKLICDAEPTDVHGRRQAYHAITGGTILQVIVEVWRLVTRSQERAGEPALNWVTFSGAAAMAGSANAPFSELKDRITSPGGTTIAGLQVLERSGLRGILMDVVEAAARRADELAPD